MTEEEKQAIEILNTFEFRRKTKNYRKISLEDSRSVKIVLNLLDKLQKENETKEKIIDDMADWLYKDDTSFGYGKLKEVNTKERIIRFFENRTKNGPKQ